MRARHTRPLRSIAEVVAMLFARVSAVLMLFLVPPNVDAGVFAPDVRRLLAHSQTFRAQCVRIAAEPRVNVRIEIVNTLDGGRAQTTIHRLSSGAIEADVSVLFGENYRELLAHEFEHVIEQLDGVNLRAEAAEGRAWELASGAFETRRAFLAGVQVMRETEPGYAHAVAILPAR
jgi:hypothetical protein